MNPLWVPLGFLLGLAAWWLVAGRGPRKQCPACGAYVHPGADVCRHCGYSFA